MGDASAPRKADVAAMRVPSSLLTTLFSFLCIATCAQQRARYSWYLEGLGNAGSIVSANVDRCSRCDSIAAFSFAQRAGLSFTVNDYDHRVAFLIPLEVSAVHGRGTWKLEYGVGFTPYIGTSDLSTDRIPEEYKSNSGSWTVLRVGVRKNMIGNSILRIAPLYVFEHWSNGRRRELWSIGVALGGYF